MSVKYIIRGKVDSEHFQKACFTGRYLAANFDNVDVECHPMFEVEWNAYVKEVTKQFGKQGVYFLHKNPGCPVAILSHQQGKDKLIGSLVDFMDHAIDEYDYQDYTPVKSYLQKAEIDFKKFMLNTDHAFCKIDIRNQSSGDIVAHVVVELYDDICPKTCENFINLCQGVTSLQYTGTTVQRVVKDGWIQCGDINGVGASTSSFGELFEDENFIVKHDTPGILGMANNGPNSNGCLFYLTLQEFPYFDCKFVAFGRVVEGLDQLQAIQDMPMTGHQQPMDTLELDCQAISLSLTEQETIIDNMGDSFANGSSTTSSSSSSSTSSQSQSQPQPSSSSAHFQPPAFVVVGPSGVGKSTLIRSLRNQYPKEAFGFSVSHTTRAPRKNGGVLEEDGIDYHFVEAKTFEQMIDNDEFLEYAVVHSEKMYGTSVKAVQSIINKRQICILDIDVQGAHKIHQLKQKGGDKLPDFKFTFVRPESIQTLEQRLRSRGSEDEQAINDRLQGATRELEFYENHKDMFDHVITNKDLDTAVTEFIDVFADTLHQCGFSPN